jgi:hypothetical protein
MKVFVNLSSLLETVKGKIWEVICGKNTPNSAFLSKILCETNEDDKVMWLNLSLHCWATYWFPKVWILVLCMFSQVNVLFIRGLTEWRVSNTCPRFMNRTKTYNILGYILCTWLFLNMVTTI